MVDSNYSWYKKKKKKRNWKKFYLNVRKFKIFNNYQDVNWTYTYYLVLILGCFLNKICFINGQMHIFLKDNKYLKIIFFFFKYNLKSQYKQLLDICCVDLFTVTKRFNLIYNLISIKYTSRIFINIFVHEFQTLDSLTFIYSNADWYEREIWDLFGIFFCNHTDLRRILTDYGFEGFPLRKDFPQSGYIEIRYNNEYKYLNYEPLELSQEFRVFDFQNPWTTLK